MPRLSESKGTNLHLQRLNVKEEKKKIPMTETAHAFEYTLKSWPQIIK